MKYLLYLFFLPVWYIIRLIPRDENVWVFGSWFGDRFSDNPRALYEFSLNQPNNENLKFVWLTNSKSVYLENKNSYLHFYMKWSLKGIWYSLRAKKVIFSSGKVDVNNYLINGATTINLWHGPPMKKIGLDNKLVFNKYVNFIKKYFFPFIYEYNINYILSTSKVFDDKLSNAFNVSLDGVLKLGYPRNDIFFSNSSSTQVIRKIDNDFLNPTKIMYLPTFRDGGNGKDLFYDYGYDPLALNQFLQTNNSVFLTKSHYAENKLNLDNNFSRIIDLKFYKNLDINLILKDIDILLTDYSGAYFDFLLTKKPVIFTSFDLEEYVSHCRELYFDFNNIISGPIAKNWSQVISSIKNIQRNDNYINKRIEMNKKFNNYNDGLSSEKLYNFIKSL